MKKTFYSHSFGCRVNQAEKEALDKQLINEGYDFNEQDPSLYIINTCSVTHKAEREAKQLIYQTRKKHPETKIVVTGCAATNWIKTKTEVDGVDMLVDNQSKEYIASLIIKRFEEKNPHRNLELSQPLTLTLANDKYLKSGRAIVKIQDGCQRFCTYCIVPYLRGLPKSISIQTIVDTVNSYPDFKEVILTAINTEAYGYDSKESFLDLVDRILEQTSIPRISFGSIHPWTFDDAFFKRYAEDYSKNKRFVQFFHVPLQSGSNKMLRLMKRGYTREEFIQKLNKVKELNRFAFIGTDVIVGFLEETNEDFNDTLSFLEQTPISKFHVFRYSERQHTAAFYLGKRLNKVDVEAKKKRAQILSDLSKRKYEEFLQKHVDHTFETLFLEKREGEYQHGLLENQIPVIVKSEKDLAGQFRNVTIFEYKNDKLFGRIV